MPRLIRAQVRLTAEQHKALRALAADRGVSVSQVLRDAIDRILTAPPEDRWRPAKRAVGAFRDNARASDVAKEHDAYLEEIRVRRKGVR